MTTGLLSPEYSKAGSFPQHADLDEFNRLMRGSKAEIDAFEAVKRRAAGHLFRVGERLIRAREIAKREKLGWYSKLSEFKIAESTARQAIKLWQQVTDAGYAEEDIEGMGITQAKVDFNVVAGPKPSGEKGAKGMDDDKSSEQAAGANEQTDEGARQEIAANEQTDEKSPPQAVENGGGNRPTAPVAHSTGPEPDGDDGRSGQDQDFDEIEISDLLVSRQQQLNEESLVRWNEGRERPFEEDYLLVLLDLGVLTVEGEKVRYLPDHDGDLEEMVGVLTDKLAPALERWATPDEVLSVLKDLVFAEAAEVEQPRPVAGEQKKRIVRVRRGGQQPRA